MASLSFQLLSDLCIHSRNLVLWSLQLVKQMAHLLCHIVSLLQNLASWPSSLASPIRNTVNIREKRMTLIFASQTKSQPWSSYFFSNKKFNFTPWLVLVRAGGYLFCAAKLICFCKFFASQQSYNFLWVVGGKL